MLPIVGCPAIGSSVPGVKMRMRMSVPAASAGRMKVHSEKFISLVIACICGGRESARVVEDGELVAFEHRVGEDVVVQIAHHSIVVREA